MLVRITRRPPRSYEVAGDSLLVGRIYDLPASLACALMVERYAELASEEAHSEERRHNRGGFTSAKAHERPRIFHRTPDTNPPDPEASA